MLEFLVGGGGGDEETFAVAMWHISVDSRGKRSMKVCAYQGSVYPAVNRPTILVPAMVV